jgi:predicted AAA+ superfamily ATPase
MYIERDIEETIFKWLGEREIIALIGPRQCGKTTLLQQIRQKVIDAGTFDRDHVIYRSLDEESERMKFTGDPVGHIKGQFIDDDPHLVLLDEVQFVENAGLHLKVVFDRFHDRMKLIITGSSGLDLRNIGGMLVGRAVYFEMHPFSFKEFLLARDRRMHRYYLEHRADLEGEGGVWPEELAHIDTLNALMEEYITFGGFPRIVLHEDPGIKETLLQQLISMCIEKDILLLYGHTFRNDAYRILKHLAFHSGGILNQSDISSKLGIEKNRVGETMNLLEDTHILKTVRPFFHSLSTELRKRPKVYLVDNGVRNALAEDFVFSREKGFLLENFVLSQLLHRDPKIRYWRTTAKAEVDFVLKGEMPVEVKSTPKITRALRSFISTYKPEKAFVVNYDKVGTQKVGGTKVHFVPACLL